MPLLSLPMRLHYGGGCGVNDIGKGFGVSGAAVSQMVERLVQAGLVARVEDPDDRRALVLRFTRTQYFPAGNVVKTRST